jgi:hypothetical protein
MSIEAKVCVQCGKTFEPNIHNQIYCSRECQYQARRDKDRKRKNIQKLTPKICAICGKEFMPVNSTQVTCGSEKCKKEQGKIRMARFREKGKATPFTKKCIICGEEFTTTNNWQKLCGKEECAKERASREKRNIPESEYKNLIGVYSFKTKNRVAVCPICGKEFTSQVWNQKYCSRECKLKRICLDRPNNLCQERECVICGKKFFPNSNSQKTCSEECGNTLEKQRQKIYNDAKPRKGIQEITCRNCGKTFLPKHFNSKFCCDECRDKYQKEFKSEYGKLHYLANKEHYQEMHSKYYLEHKEETLERSRKNRAIRRQTDPDYRVKCAIRAQVRDHLSRYLLTKNFHTFELFGYTSAELVERLQSLFKEKSLPDREPISWDNYGKTWHIHHKDPCAHFKFATEDGKINKDEIKRCWRLDNLEPEYADINVAKSSNYEGVYYEKGEAVRPATI